jgi:RND family efflux transporter MFP subunit
MKKFGLFGQIILPLIILALGGLGTMAIVKSGEKGERKKREVAPTTVETVSAKVETRKVSIEAMGRVQAAQEVIMRSEVGGVVEAHHPALSVGARLKAGEELIKIDTRDYSLALAQQRSNVARAAMEVKLEKGRRNVAEHEWKLLDNAENADSQSRDLVLRKPQGQSAQAGLKAAKSGLQRAKLALEKTSIQVPFDAIVLVESVEKGQLVGPSVPLATLVGTDRFHVRTSIPVDRLGTMKIPGVNVGPDEGASATVTHLAAGGVKIVRKAKVLRLMGALEAQGNMAQLLLAIDNPLKVDPERTGYTLPLLLGMRVEVNIDGIAMDQVSIVPRRALRMENTVWLVDGTSKLRHKAVEVVWREREHVWLRGLEDGAVVIVSPLATPVDGLTVEAHAEEEVPSS